MAASLTPLSSETLHATCIAIGGRGVLLTGASGTGKSDLALRLLDRGAALVSDDYTLLTRDGARIVATGPATIVGRMEVRGIGIVDMPALASAPVALIVRIVDAAERMPERGGTRTIAGIALPEVALNALEPSAPLKVELALRHLGASA